MLVTTGTELKNTRAIDAIATAKTVAAILCSAEKKRHGVDGEILLVLTDEHFERLEEIGNEKFLQQWRAVFFGEAVERHDANGRQIPQHRSASSTLGTSSRRRGAQICIRAPEEDLLLATPAEEARASRAWLDVGSILEERGTAHAALLLRAGRNQCRGGRGSGSCRLGCSVLLRLLAHRPVQTVGDCRLRSFKNIQNENNQI